jgi:predicted nucleotidyltransferase component of viral defense system
MISLDAIRSFYPEPMRSQGVFQKHILKEYVQLLVLDHLATTPHVRKLAFIGGTSLRLLKGIARFSEDLDFDCKGLDDAEFRVMTDDVLRFLARNGFRPEVRDVESARLTAFRRSIHFPGLLHELGLTGHREERFLLRIEAQDQGVPYACMMGTLRGCGLFFPFPVPPDPVLCAMKISAMLDRRKGRDYFDAMFLLAQTAPDYTFLAARNGVRDWPDLQRAIEDSLQAVDLNRKRMEFEHLLFHRDDSRRILRFREFVHALPARN